MTDTLFTKTFEALKEINLRFLENTWQVLDEGETLSTRTNKLKNNTISLICQQVFEIIPISSRASIPRSHTTPKKLLKSGWKVIS